MSRNIDCINLWDAEIEVIYTHYKAFNPQDRDQQPDPESFEIDELRIGGYNVTNLILEIKNSEEKIIEELIKLNEKKW